MNTEIIITTHEDDETTKEQALINFLDAEDPEDDSLEKLLDAFIKDQETPEKGKATPLTIMKNETRERVHIERHPRNDNASPICGNCESRNIVRRMSKKEQYWDGKQWELDAIPTTYACKDCGKKSKTAIWVGEEET